MAKCCLAFLVSVSIIYATFYFKLSNKRATIVMQIAAASSSHSNVEEFTVQC